MLYRQTQQLECHDSPSDLHQKQDQYSDETFYGLISIAMRRIRKSMFGSTMIVVNEERKFDAFLKITSR